MVKQQAEALRLADALVELDAQFSHPGLCGEAAAELRRLHRIEDAFNTWLEKTQWVQETAGSRDLGKHRADVMKDRIDCLQSKNMELLTFVMEWLGMQGTDQNYMVIRARAAISKFTGEQQ